MLRKMFVGFLLLTILSGMALAGMGQGAWAADEASIPGEAAGPAMSTPILQVGGEPPFAQDVPLLEVFFLNLGQGDGFFLRCGGQTLLVDGGYGDQFPILLNFLLREHGSLRLGSILNTHQHEDHIGAQCRLLASGGSAAAFYSPLPPQAKNAAYQRLYPLLEAAETPFVQLFPGDTLDFGGTPGESVQDVGALPLTDAFVVRREPSATLTAYYCTNSPPDVNSASLWLHVAFGQRSLLLTADATGWAQSSLLSTLGDALQADILKTGHHGLEASVSAFLDQVNPALAIVTNDRKTAHLQATQLENRSIPALFTAEGLVYLATDGKTWYVRQE